MNRLMTVVLMTVMLAGAAEHAAAASWQLPQPSGGKLTLTVTDTIIRIVTSSERIEIPITQVQSLHVTTRYLDPTESQNQFGAIASSGAILVKLYDSTKNPDA